jgi:hypothetical protein
VTERVLRSRTSHSRGVSARRVLARSTGLEARAAASTHEPRTRAPGFIELGFSPFVTPQTGAIRVE